jgi:hypothetical protein
MKKHEFIKLYYKAEKFYEEADSAINSEELKDLAAKHERESERAWQRYRKIVGVT